MDVPKTWQEFVIWVGMQFLVVAVAFLVARWVIRWNGEQRKAEVDRIDRDNLRVLAEKDARLADRDALIAELKAEVKLPRELHFPSLRPDRKADGGPDR